MKKRINLFDKKRSAGVPTLIAEKLVFYGTLASIGFFIIFLVFTVISLKMQGDKNAMLAEKKTILEDLNKQNTELARMNFLSKKEGQLKIFLQDDARFLPYYNLLKDALLPASDSAPILETMNIDKDKNTEFTVHFTTYEPAFDFLKYMESETFLDNFKELKLEGFSLNSDIASSQGYELQFKGKFKTIDE